MPSSLTIQNTLNWEGGYLDQQPCKINGMEPALSSANLVLSTLLSPPLAWPWNRSTAAFSTSGQDFTLTGLTNFGYLEGGSMMDANGQPWELEVKNVLHPDMSQARPRWCSPLIDDGMGNITFRLSPGPPTGTSTGVLIYQRRAPILMSLGTTWSPVPDDRIHMCQWGHLSLMSLIGNDARFNSYNQKFVTAVLSSNGGLTAMERNMFLANWTIALGQVQSKQLQTSEQFKAREV